MSVTFASGRREHDIDGPALVPRKLTVRRSLSGERSALRLADMTSGCWCGGGAPCRLARRRWPVSNPVSRGRRLRATNRMSVSDCRRHRASEHGHGGFWLGVEWQQDRLGDGDCHRRHARRHDRTRSGSLLVASLAPFAGVAAIQRQAKLGPVPSLLTARRWARQMSAQSQAS